MSDWSFNGSNDIAEKLAELNQWQVEQQKKLKTFQETQRQLLDSDHRKLLDRLRTCNFEEKEMETSDMPNENDGDAPVRHRPFLRRGEGLARFRMTLDDFKAPPNIYKEKKIKTYLKEKPDFHNKRYPIKKSSSLGNCRKQLPKSRPRCSTVPVNIYIADNKNKKVNSRPEPKVVSATNFNNYKKPRDLPLLKAPSNNLVLKSSSVAADWYNFQEKPIERIRSPESKEIEKQINKDDFNNNKKSRDLPWLKAPISNLVLKPTSVPLESVCSPESKEMEKQMKKDDNELKMFEMLEGKVNDSSFCSNSSFVAKFMEESISSTPAKFTDESENQQKLQQMNYTEGLKNLQKQYLEEEQIKLIEDLGEEFDTKENKPEEKKITEKNFRKPESDETGKVPQMSYMENLKNMQKQYLDEEQISLIDDPDEEDETKENKSGEKKTTEKIIRKPEPLKFMKERVLQEYIKNFKKMKSDITETVNKAESESVADTTTTEASPQKDLRQLNQHEAALKIQRKALQDNVKHLLNWDGSVRKKPPKKLVKKNKIKQPKSEKPKKIEKEQNKIIFDGALLKQRLEELEKEIEIFRKENRVLTKLQKDLEDDRSKFEKEKKEFAKNMQEEKENFEAKMNEEQKKLQRDKNVFEKYCKQAKNQPTKQEREEIVNLKKEVGKLTEMLSTKESRWGANQARLRNQIKALEKENAQLKTDIEKYKKQIVKKVTFDKGKNVETKIIHAINSELGKIKPLVIRNEEPVTANQRYQSLSARVDTNLKSATIRRNKSAEGLLQNDVIREDRLAKTVRSVSTDSGVETNDTRLLNSRRSNDLEPNSNLSMENFIDNQDIPTKIMPPQVDNEDLGFPRTKEFGDEAVHEALFSVNQCKSSNPKILEIKHRLGKLRLLNKTDPLLERRRNPNDHILADKRKRYSEDIVDGDCSSSNSSDGSYETGDDSDEEDNSSEDRDPYFSKKVSDNPVKYTDLDKNYVVETKISENGIREKIHEDGRKEIFYPNGNIKKISPKNDIIKMIYYNGDVKESNIPEGSEKYYYAETKTWHTTYKDGLEVLEFPNGQTERRRPDGSTEISFPNGCVRYCDPSGIEEWRFVDGTVVKTNKDGHKVLLMPNGQKETHTKEYKKREYPDGTLKLLYADGTQETRYVSGRVRLKDKDGNLVMDSGGIR